MKIVYIISRSTSANRSAKDHADNGHGQPLCGDKPRGKFNGWARDDGKVTCEKCLALLAESEVA